MISPLDDPEHAAVVARFRVSLANLPERQRLTGETTLQRISTANWYFEWHLPLWLGRSFSLSPAVAREIVLSNVYGLAFVRLMDDLLDEDYTALPGNHLQLVRVFHSLWIQQYAALFDQSALFWEQMAQFTGEWLNATLRPDGPTTRQLKGKQEAACRLLAGRGAPLKICCTGISMLAQRQDELPYLYAGVEHYLTGAVLVDHADDWEEDLQHGRYNAFTAYLSQHAAPYPEPHEIRKEVLEELYLKNSAQDYFEFAGEEFQKARDCFQHLRINELDEYLKWVKAKSRQKGEAIGQEGREYVKLAAKALRESGQIHS